MLSIDNNTPSCPICSSQQMKDEFELYDDRYGYPGLFRLESCSSCGHRVLRGRFSAELLTTLYSDYYPRSALDIKQYHALKEVRGFGSWLNGEKRSAYSWVPKNVRVLDIGCGFGESLGYHQSRGCDVYGVESDANIRRVADKYGFRVHVGLFDPDLYKADYFDYVTMDQVIEHVSDPLATMRGIARVLRPGGRAIVSTPNSSGWGARLFGRRWINWHAPYHLQLFSLESMRRAAEQAGLNVESARTITLSAWLHYQWLHLVSYPKEGQPSVFWSPKGKKTFVQAALIKSLSLLHRTRINHVVTRIFDLLGKGDNFLFILRKA